MTTASATLPQVGEACSNCGSPLVSERAAVPWCARCGWNIDFYEPDRRRRELRWRWADKLSFQAAYDLNERQFATLAGRPVNSPPISWASALLILISIIMLAFLVALAGLGEWLITSHHGIVAIILGCLCLLLLWVMSPNLGKLGKYADPHDPSEFPTLDRLIGQVSAAIGARRPHVVLFDMNFAASSRRYGWRRRRCLVIGLPSWLSLAPQEQVALIAYLLDEFASPNVNGSWLTQYAYQPLRALAFITRPDSGESRYRARAGRRGSSMSILGDLVTRPIFAVLSVGTSILQLTVEWIGAHASRHDAYAADAVAAHVAGSAATVGVLDAGMQTQVCMTMLRKAIQGEPSIASWRKVVAAGRLESTPRVQRLRQLTMRDHALLSWPLPPAGMRARLIESRPAEPARLVLSESEAAQIDVEMASVYRTFKTDMAGITHL